MKNLQIIRFNIAREDGRKYYDCLQIMQEVTREEITAIVLGDLRTKSSYMICKNVVYCHHPDIGWRRREADITECLDYEGGDRDAPVPAMIYPL